MYIKVTLKDAKNIVNESLQVGGVSIASLK